MAEAPKSHRARAAVGALGASWFVLIAWAGFWVFFSVAEMVGDVPGAIGHLLFPMAPIAALIALAWMRPVLGGTLLVLFGGATLFFVTDPFVWGLLSAPPMVAGLALALLARRPLAGRGVETPS